MGITLDKHNYICDYYVCFNKKSEFIFMATADVDSYSLSKQFLLDEIFVNHPTSAKLIKESSELRYKTNIRSALMIEREKHIMEINKQSPYK